MLTVSATGLLTSVGPVGNATIVVRDAELTESIEATVTLLPSGISATPNPLVVQVGLAAQLSAVVTDANGEPIPDAPVTFVSGDPNLVVVGTGGTVTSVGAQGSTTITVISAALQTTVPVDVTQIVGGFMVTPTSLVLPPGGNQALSVTVLDLLNLPIPGAAVAFRSSNTAVATVSAAGVVTSVGPDGTTTITITSGNFNTQVEVRVGGELPGTVLATVPIDGTGYGVAVTAAGKYYATTVEGTVYAGALPGYGFSTSFSTGGQALAIAVNANGTTGYVAQGVEGTTVGIAIVELVTSTVTGIIPVPNSVSFSVCLSQDENTLFVGTDQGLQVIDVPSKAVVNASLATGSINSISRQAGSGLLYATVFGGPILEIDGPTRTIVRTLPVTGKPQGTIASQDGTELYIATEGVEMQIWNLTTNQLEQTVPGADGFGIALSPDGSLIYVANPSGTPAVKVIDRVSRTVLRTTANAGAPRRIAFDPTTGIGVVTNESGWVDFVK